MAQPIVRLRTIEVEPDEFSLIKPGELVDIVELSPLTLQDRRLYNLLILNAWDSITEPKEHCIRKKDLRGSHNVNDRVEESLLRLMGAVAQVRIEREGEDGGKLEEFTRRVQLLGTTDDSVRQTGVIYYTFPAALRAIIKQSTQFARLQRDVMFAFKSKYALALYEMVQKRGNLKWKNSEEFPLDRFRALLGVENGKLTEYKSFKQRAIDQAVLEVNGLGEYGCKIEPLLSGRKVTSIKLTWWTKSIEEKREAFRELKFSRVGRKARLAGKVELISSARSRLEQSLPHSNLLPSTQFTFDEGHPDSLPLNRNQSKPAHPNLLPIVRAGEGATHPESLPSGRNALTEREYARFRTDFPGQDIDWLEREFRDWVGTREWPKNYAAAFYGFVKQKQKEAE